MADDDDLERLRRHAEQLNQAVAAAHDVQTTGTSSDGTVTATARGGRLVDVTLSAAPQTQGGAAAAHRDLVDAVREAAATALQRSNEQLQDAARTVSAAPQRDEQ